MRLRTQLALRVIGVVAPAIFGLATLRSYYERRARESAIREFVILRMNAGERLRCEAAPERFGGPPRLLMPGLPSTATSDLGAPAGADSSIPAPHQEMVSPVPMELWAYARDFVSANVSAPPFPAALKEEMLSGASVADAPYEVRGSEGRQAAIRTPWVDGPCAFVLVRTEKFPVALLPPPTAVLALSVVLLSVAVFLASAGVVRRLRRLTRDVSTAVATQYARPVAVSGSDEISDLARAFNAAGGEIQRYIEAIEARETALREFVADTTHDLMVPLTVLQGHLAALRRVAGNRRGEDAASDEVMASAISDAAYLGALVHNLGAATKLEVGSSALELQPVHLPALVHRVVARFRELASAVGVEVEASVPEDPVHVYADVTLLEQAVSNVFHNAVRHNRQGGHAAMVLDLPSERPGTFVLCVVDDGPGVDVSDLGKLGTRGWRRSVSDRQARPGGGLGLHIARSVADRLGLSIVFAVREGGGLRVEFAGLSCPGPVPDTRQAGASS